MLLLAVMVLALGLGLADAKGVSSSSYGGTTRSYKSGYYSRSSRYSVGYMYWGSGGYRGTRYRSSAPSNPSGSKVNGVQVANAASMENAFCNRDVRVDGPSNGAIPKWAAANTKLFQINSTQKCVQQMSTQPGSPLNTEILDLQLNRYQWSVSTKTTLSATAKYPLLEFKVYPDFDAQDALITLSLQLLNVVVRDYAGSVVTTYPLNVVNFQTCTIAAGCSNEMPYPAVTRMDFAKQVSYNITGTLAAGVSISLQFTVTNDFAEDSDIDHIFLRPSAIKMNVQLTMPTDGLSASYVDVEAIVFSPKTGAGSRVYTADVTPIRLPVEYDPKAMSRVMMGDPADAAGGYVSWWSTTDNLNLCLASNTAQNSSCVVGSPPVVACPGGAYDARCQVDTATSTGTLLKWSFRRNVQTWPMGVATWYMNLGFSDPAEVTDPNSGASATSIAVAVLALVVAIVIA